MSFELLINSVDGWMPDTRLYRRVEDSSYWLVSVINTAAVVKLYRSQMGVVYDTEDLEPPSVEIYRADVTRSPVYSEWVADEDNPPGHPPDGAEVTQDDTTTTWSVEGARWGGMHRTITDDVDFHITPIDADGDPLNGLTPWAVLDPGATFEQALDYIAADV